MKPLVKSILLVNLLFAVYIFISWLVHTFTALPTPTVGGIVYPYTAYLLGFAIYYYPFVVLSFTLLYLYKQTSWRSFFKSLLIPFSYTLCVSILVWLLLITKIGSSSAFWFSMVWVGILIQAWITLGGVIVLAAVFVFGRNYLLPTLGLQKRKR